jgi:hypothetical protein
MLSLETEGYYMNHGEYAFQAVLGSNGLMSSIQDVLS